MKTPFLALSLSLFCGAALAAENAPTAAASVKPASVALAPKAVIQLEFPELSANMRTMFEDKPVPNLLVAELPANYTPQGKFPMVVFLGGSNGGDVLKTDQLREAVGPEEFICVRLPLFKAANIASDPVGGRQIGSKDFDIISKNYRVMLQKLLDTVPNITRERSTFGGFSNGAHTTAVLLEGKDAFLIEHFTHFYCIEGGGLQLGGETLHNPVLKAAHFLVLVGDKSKNPLAARIKVVAADAKARSLDFTALPMRGYGHEMPLDYLKLLAPWMRGQALPTVAPKPLAP